MTSKEQQPSVEPIAVIGMHGRFPDARSVGELWGNLKDGVESLKPFTVEEVLGAGIDPSWLKAPGYVTAGTVLDDVDMFDALFFGFSARDAEVIDPQQRLFLEVAWESLEMAGYDPDTFPGAVAVFGGSEQSSYLYQLFRNSDRIAYADPAVLIIGNDKDYLTTQVSYKLNLKGPSMAVQTACSTSLVAVCMACQCLWSEQCDMALAGGVSVGIPQKKGYWYQPGGIFSPDGHCRTFDAEGQGTVVGNGVAIVVLRRLADALAYGDQIHAIIKGVAINNDGSAKVGFSAPSVEGQSRAIRAAHKMAGIEPETIGYVEAHGTATLLGDPIEVAALSEVFRERTRNKSWCAIGSLKSNLGHLASAAGVSGLIKTVLMLENKTLVPSVNFKTPNPQIDFANSPFYVNTKLQPWESNGSRRRAGVSSFGVGGTNAHVILEEAPESEASGPAARHQLILISAKTGGALESATTNLAEHLKRHPELNMADVAFTTQVGRRPFGYRRVLITDSTKPVDVARALEERDPMRVMTRDSGAFDRPLVFLFSGQGTQYANMGRDLNQDRSDYRSEVDRCCDLLEPHLDLDLRTVLYPECGDEDSANALLKRTSLTQPALFVIEYALARLWMSWGIVPKALMGHSIGEYVAACISGVFSLEDALHLVAIRGQLMEQMPSGSMLGVPLAEAEARLLLKGGLSLAAVNAPFLSVLSGPSEEVDAVANQLAARGLQVRKLQTSHAFHSSMMDPILERFRDLVKSFERKAPQIPFISNVTGTWISSEQAQDPDYWSRHLRSTVQFGRGLEELLRAPDVILLEIGPGRTLQTFAQQQMQQTGEQTALGSMRSSQEPVSDTAFLLRTLGQLWLHRVQINWKAFSSVEKRRRLELPTYPFERQRYWIAASNTGDLRGSSAATERDISTWFYTPTWKPAAASQPAKLNWTKARWLVFSDAEGIGEEMAEQLRATGANLTMVSPSDRFARTPSNDYFLRADRPSDYHDLCKEVCGGGDPPQFIVHLWSVTRNFEENFETAQLLGFYSLLHLAQALEKQNVTAPIQMAFVSNHLQSVVGDEPLCPSKATALGACKVLPQEYPNLRCRAIDIALDSGERGKLAELLIGELSAEPFEPVVAYRKSRRWIQVFEPTKLQKSEDRPAIRDGGVYLITGGLGNLGLVVAESLARAASGVKLVLTGRSALPERDRWEQWIAAQGPDDPISRKMRRLIAIEELGARVCVLSADASDHDQMRSVIERAEQDFGAINGVIHGAGNTNADGFLPASQVDRRAAEAQFRPKAQGILVLEELLQDKPIDFCLMLSSISGVLGGLGLLSYASANLFLDAFAARQNRLLSRPWISVNWDAWQFPADERAFKNAMPNWRDYILPSEGADAFQRILRCRPGHIVVSATDLHKRLQKWVQLESLREMQSGASKAGSFHPRPSLSNQFVAPRTPTEQVVAAAWENLLGVAPIGIHDQFMELGGHSLLAIQLIAKLRESFQVELPPQRVFEAPTVRQFAASIDADIKLAKERQVQQEEKRVAELLDLVEGMSEGEVAAMLATMDGPSARGAHG